MTKSSKTKRLCECADPGCPEGHGKYDCNAKVTTKVRRVDMEDGTTTFFMCDVCAKDALDSGVFA